MPTTTPLLLLLDGVLSQDRLRMRQAMNEMSVLQLPVAENSLEETTLEDVIECVMRHKPEWANVASERDGSLPLHFAASIGNVVVARLILQCNREAPCLPNQKGKIPLHYAAREGRTDMVEFLLKEAPETAAIRSKKDKLALHFAAGEGHMGVVRALLQTYPDGASLPSKKGKVAVHFAARWGHVTVAKDLLAISPESIKVLDYEGSSPLHDAAREGQLEMVKFLVKRYPQGLHQANLRGETPLFPAVRSGNLELVRFMIHVWPYGGRHVLQRVREEDDVATWAPEMLELCLRGAVNIWEEKESSDVTMDTGNQTDEASVTSTGSPSVDSHIGCQHGDFSSPSKETSIPSFEMSPQTYPRSKSPNLGEGRQPPLKKRCLKDDSFAQKRARIDPEVLEWVATSEHRSFFELHSALECRASAPVLKCILDRYGDSQIDALDELGRMPLHVAIESCCAHVDIILERIWGKYPEACSHRDFLGRLPLHHALLHRSDPQLIKALLDANPSSGVEYCEVLDARFIDKVPLEMAMASGCDLSTIYMLLRGDPSLTASWTQAYH